MTKLENWFAAHRPERLMIFGYLCIVMIGLILLSLPFSQSIDTSTLDNLFIATSALSTTGLITVSTPDNYTFFGELVILILIQIGGIGYMSIGSFIIIGRSGKLNAASLKLLQTDFALPEKYSILHFVKDVIVFCFLIELLGAIGLYFAFSSAGVEDAVWQAIFHSISAFCTAGFSLFNNSLEDFATDPWVNIIVGLLAFGGALGFIVFSDYMKYFRDPRKKITLTSKIIIRFTFTIFIISAILLAFDPGFAPFSSENQIIVAIFQAFTALTTVGFNSFPIGALAPPSLFVMVIIMIIGASPSGTGGGLKTTTVSALYYQLLATLKGSKGVTCMSRRIPEKRIRLAGSHLFFYVGTLFIGIILLLFLQKQPMIEVVFEAASALGTVGLSMGLTGALVPLSKLVVIVLMFLGRIGPLSLGIALTNAYQDEHEDEEEDLAL